MRLEAFFVKNWELDGHFWITEVMGWVLDFDICIQCH